MSKKLNIRENMYETDELDIQIGKTQVIIPMQERICPSGFVFKLLNGEIVVGGAMSGVDYPTDRPTIPMPPDQTSREFSWRRSKDGGETWEETPAWPSYGVHQFADNGEIMCVSGKWCEIKPSSRYVYSIAFFHSVDNGYTFEKKKAWLYDIPKLAEIGEHRDSDAQRYANVNHGMVRLSDGSLLASVQGRFENDIKERTFIIRSVKSAGRGKDWFYLSTVAFDLTKKGIRPLGFDEPNLLVLPSGDILCFMRTGSRKGGSLYMSRSRDNGQTWSHADPIADRGVYPTACLMKNGVIVVVYGRPGDWLTFSLDEGESWVNHFCFNQSPEPNDCGNYDWLEEVEENKLLVIYGRADPNNCMNSAILGTYFVVKPKKIDK